MDSYITVLNINSTKKCTFKKKYYIGEPINPIKSMNTTKLLTLVALSATLLLGGKLSAATTLFKVEKEGFYDIAGQSASGLAWGLLFDTAQDGFHASGSSLSYDSMSSNNQYLPAGGVMTDDYYAHGGVTQDNRALPVGGIGGYIDELLLDYQAAGFSSQVVGAPFVLTWYNGLENTFIQAINGNTPLPGGIYELLFGVSASASLRVPEPSAALLSFLVFSAGLLRRQRA